MRAAAYIKSLMDTTLSTQIGLSSPDRPGSKILSARYCLGPEILSDNVYYVDFLDPGHLTLRNC